MERHRAWPAGKKVVYTIGMQNSLKTPALVFILAVALMGVAYVFPWRDIKWGTIEQAPSRTITVTGEGQQKERNQVAQFSAGVSATNEDKEKAIAEVNTKMDEILTRLREFGIPSDDIQTQNLSVYKMEKPYFEYQGMANRPDAWQVNNSVQITLREVEKASALTDLLSATGATNVFGPNFMLDDGPQVRDELLQDAIENAREKAAALAKASGRKLGGVVNVVEGGYNGGVIYPMAARDMAGGGGVAAPVEPGATTISQSVTVTFELK